ncbi:MAG: Si-specific NAD(P)(+) transhydrogenase, partial [Fibrobacterales bacterium]
MHYDYDLVVLGSGPAGQKAALKGAKLGKRVALIEPHRLGGLCTHVGTVPSKTFREAAIHLTNYRLRYMEPLVSKQPTMKELLRRVEWVISKEVEVMKNQIERNGIDIIHGYGKFKDTHHINILNSKKNRIRTISTQYTVIATGTQPFMPENIPFDHKKILLTDDVFKLEKLPKSLTIVGGGIIGCEYTSIFSILDTKVNLVEQRDDILALSDREMRAHLIHQLDGRKVNLCLGDEVTEVKKNKDGNIDVILGSQKVLKTEAVLFCTFRNVCTGDIGLDKVNVKTNPRGHIAVDETYVTSNKNIFAAGDVVGHPSLASTGFEQGRIAVSCAFGEKCAPLSKNFPVGIYTIPEISFVGPTESQLTRDKIPYSVGKAYYKETSKGVIMGAMDGMLKIIFHQKTRKILSVHVIGENASEIVH